MDTCDCFGEVGMGYEAQRNIHFIKMRRLNISAVVSKMTPAMLFARQLDLFF